MKLPTKIFLFPLLLLSFSNTFGQGYLNVHPFDFKKFNLGFTMGLNYNAYNLKEQVQVEDEGVLLNNIEVFPKYGLTLGMITNYSIHNYLAVRFIPSISLEERNFNYYFADGEIGKRKIEASYLNLPLLFQFRSKYHNKLRLYTLAGGQLGINLASNKKVRDNPDLLKIRAEDVSIVLGVGFNIYGDRIKLSPELRYSMGLINIYEPKFTSHASAIEELYSQVLTLIINFE